jgi:DNA-binding NarL/FixJ family response regulator
MIIISSSPDSLVIPARQSSSTAASARKPQATSDNVPDSIQIHLNSGSFAGLVQPTQAQQVQQLYRRGNTVPQIAYKLNLSAQAVDGYLNIAKGK